MTKLLAFFLLCSSIAFAKVPAKTEVLIVGAGLSGLATAYELKKAGIPFHILELTPRIGGRVRTVHYKRPGEPELYADSGMEEYWESNPAVPMLQELKLPLRSDTALSSMVIGGKLEPLGKDGENPDAYFKRALGEVDAAKLEAFKKRVEPLVREIIAGKHISPELMKLKDVSFARWAGENGLTGKAAEWVRISIECEIGTAWDRLSALDGLAEFHIFLGTGEKSFRVVGGNEKFTDALSKNIGMANISVNKRVNRIVTKGKKVYVTYLDQSDNSNGVIEAAEVVSTIPLFRLFEVQFEPALSQKKRDAITSQMWGSYFKAHIFVPASAKKFWTKDGIEEMPILSDSELGVVYDGNPDQDTKTKIVSLLVTGDAAEAFNMMPLDQVRTRIYAAFDKLWPGFSKEIQGVEFYRFHPRAIASWPVGRSRFDEMSNEIRKPDNHVYLSGDFTEGTHSSGAFMAASRVAGSIIENHKAPRHTSLPVRQLGSGVTEGRSPAD
jgi:monoamine oxidase